MLRVLEKDLTKLATVRTVAKTKHYADIATLDDLIAANTFSKKHNLKLQIIGKGTNILFSQRQYDNTLFIKLKKGFNYFSAREDFVEIGASYSFMRAGEKLIAEGYSDFLYMCLIPGTLGGGVRQNAGTTDDGEIQDNIIEIQAFDTHCNEVKVLHQKMMAFSYRDSLIQKENGRYIILSARFAYGKKENPEHLQSLLVRKRQEREKKQPRGYSFGSTFKSLLYEKPAWWYIEEVGLRGHVVGGAKFSEQHANWIINFDHAKADDIIALITMAKTRVSSSFDVIMQEEVELI